MSLTINTLVQIDPVQSRAFTTERDDSGFSRQSMTVTGYTDRDRTNLAAAKETARQLNEMAGNYHYRIVHVADSEDSQYDGMYELRGATVTATPTTSNSTAALFSVSVTLRRLGGASASGANVMRRVSTVAALQSAAWGHAVLAYIPTPVGATPLQTATPTYWYRTGEDGTMAGQLTATPAPLAYVMSGADVNKAECKLWDTGPTPDVRVWSADHTFASAADVMIDNGLVRIGPTVTAGYHFVQAWDSTNNAWADVVATGTGGDFVTIGGSSSHTTLSVLVNELSPWRIQVTWQYLAAVTPFLWTKQITVERGKHLAEVVITPVAAATITMRPMETRFIMSRRTTDTSCGVDITMEGTAVLSTLSDNFLVGLNATTDDIVRVAALASTSPVASVASSALRVTAAAATSLTVHVGGVPYDCTRAHVEAEAASLAGGATTTAALANDSGNSVVQLDAVSESVSMFTMNSPPAGSHVIAWFRIAASVAAASANAGNTLQLAIRNNTTAVDAVATTLLATNTTFFATANTLVWAAVEVAGWNGTDQLYPYAIKTGSPTAAAFYIDEVIFLTISAPNSDKSRNVANLAMTDQSFWESIDRVVW